MAPCRVDEIPRNAYRKHSVNVAGEVFRNLTPPGEPLLEASGLFVPTPQESRSSLLRIRRKFRISRAQLAVVLGVPKDSLRRWETRDRTPCMAARRLIQLVETIFFSEESLGLGLGSLMIGQINVSAVDRAKFALLPDSARPFLERFARAHCSRESRIVPKGTPPRL